MIPSVPILGFLLLAVRCSAYDLDSSAESSAEMQKVASELENELKDAMSRLGDAQLQDVNAESSGEEPEDERKKTPSATLSASAPTSTTPAKTATSATMETTTLATTTTTTSDPDTCTFGSSCYKDADCGRGQAAGRCLGSELKTCDCNACVPGLTCTSDDDCGGLKAACDGPMGLCNCVEAFKAHGYNLFVNVILRFCRQTACSEANKTFVCFGLPCKIGRCVCP